MKMTWTSSGIASSICTEVTSFFANLVNDDVIGFLIHDSKSLSRDVITQSSILNCAR